MNDDYFNPLVRKLILEFELAVTQWAKYGGSYLAVESAKNVLLSAIMVRQSLSERDQLAMHATISLMAQAKLDCPTAFMKKGYDLADAMMAHREKER